MYVVGSNLGKSVNTYVGINTSRKEISRDISISISSGRKRHDLYTVGVKTSISTRTHSITGCKLNQQTN